MKLEHGDRQLAGTYWSERGPVRVTLEDWIWDEHGPHGPQWVMGLSPRGVEILKETVKPK